MGCGAGLEMRAAPARGPGSVAGEAPAAELCLCRACSPLSPASQHLQPAATTARAHARAHTPLFKAQRRSLALRAVSCGIVVRTKFDGERCCEACAQRAAAGDADGGPGG